VKDVEGVKKLQTRQLNFLYLLLLIAYIPMLFLGLTDYDEGAFAATSLQMLRDGQYFVPLLGEELRLEKPILSYWIQSLFLAIFGNNELKFKIDPFKKKCLIEGLDDIALSLEKSSHINEFEKKVKSARPWIFND